MKHDPEEITFLHILAVLSIVIGIIYIILIGILDLDTVRIFQEDRSISLFKYSVIFWILLFTAQYFVHRKRKISFKVVGKDLLILVWCFYIYSIILENATYTYNNSDETSVKTEKLIITERDYKSSWRSSHKKGAFRQTTYYIYTDSKNKDLKRIIITSEEYSDLEIGDFVYVHYYKGKLGSAFTTLDIPTNSIEEDVVDAQVGIKVDNQKDVLIEIISHKHFLLKLTFLFLSLFVPIIIILLYIPVKKIDIAYKTFLPITFFPCLISYVLYLIAGWSAFITLMNSLWIGMWLTGFLAIEVYNLAIPQLIKLKNTIGNRGYYAVLTFVIICLCFSSFFLINYIMDIINR